MLKKYWARITGADKGKQFPEHQAEAMGRVGDFAVIFPVGYYANLDVDALVRAIDEGLAISSTTDRPEGIEPGEVTVFHPKTKTRIVFGNDESVEIVGGVVNVKADEVNLGEGGEPIGRVGDEVQVTIPLGAFNVNGQGSSPIPETTLTGIITEGGGNTST